MQNKTQKNEQISISASSASPTITVGSSFRKSRFGRGIFSYRWCKNKWPEGLHDIWVKENKIKVAYTIFVDVVQFPPLLALLSFVSVCVDQYEEEHNFLPFGPNRRVDGNLPVPTFCTSSLWYVNRRIPRGTREDCIERNDKEIKELGQNFVRVSRKKLTIWVGYIASPELP